MAGLSIPTIPPTLASRVRLYLLWAMAAALPWAGIDGVQWFSLLLIALCLLTIGEGDWLGRLRRLRHHPIALGIVGIYLWLLLGLLYTEHWADAEHELMVKLPLILLPWAILGSDFTLNRKQMHTLCDIYLASLVIISLLTFSIGFDKVLMANIYQRDAMFWQERPYLGMMMVFGFLLCLYYLFFERRNFVKEIIVLIVAIYFLFFMYVLYVKMAFIILFLTIFLYLNYFVFRYKKYILAFFLYFSVLLAIAYVYISSENIQKAVSIIISGKNFSREDDPLHLHSSVNTRYASWNCTWQLINRDVYSIVLGYGTGDAQHHLTQCYKSNYKFDFADEYTFNAHNEFLQVALRSGIFSFIYFLSTMLYLLYYSAKNKKILLNILLLIIFSFCITESLLSRQIGVSIFAYWLTILLIYHKKPLPVSFS